MRMMSSANWFLSGNWNFTSEKCWDGLLCNSRTKADSIRMFMSMPVIKIIQA